MIYISDKGINPQQIFLRPELEPLLVLLQLQKKPLENLQKKSIQQLQKKPPTTAGQDEAKSRCSSNTSLSDHSRDDL